MNTEDQKDLCDFHVPAAVRRGDLLLTVSTGGASPALARVLKQHLDAQFGDAWGANTAEVAKLRHEWREDGVPLDEFTDRTKAHIKERGWLA